MAKTRFRYEAVWKADLTDDQKTAAAILTALASSVTQQDLQEFILSQIKRIIHGNNPGHWYDDFVAAGIPSLQQLAGEVVGVALAGAKDGVNRVFTTPSKYVHIPGGRTVELFHNGHRLAQALAPDIRLGDYYPLESGGPGSGFDTVVLLSFAPAPRSSFLASYLAA